MYTLWYISFFCVIQIISVVTESKARTQRNRLAVGGILKEREKKKKNKKKKKKKE